MIENLRRNPDYWSMFPVSFSKKEIEAPLDKGELPRTNIKLKQENPLINPLPATKGGFSDQVVSFTNRLDVKTLPPEPYFSTLEAPISFTNSMPRRP